MNVAIIDEGDLSDHRKPGHLQSLSWTRSSTAISLVGGIHSCLSRFCYLSSASGAFPSQVGGLAQSMIDHLSEAHTPRALDQS